MIWASALSLQPNLNAAFAQAAAVLDATLGGPPDAVFPFVSSHHRDAYGTVPALFHHGLPGATVFGCSAAGVIGAEHEEERKPALALTGARLPGVEIEAIHIESNAPVQEAQFWCDRLGTDSAESLLLVLADPFTCDATALIEGLDAAFPDVPKAGGLASGAIYPGGSALFVPDGMHRTGAAVLRLRGPLGMHTVVAQGCKPIGEPMFVTRHRDNVILALNNERPIGVLENLFKSLGEHDQELFQGSLFVGIEMREDESGEYRAGDFLIRNLVGIDPQSGGIAVAGHIKPYTVAQFHLRDAGAAAEDLRRLLGRFKALGAGGDVAGGLMFSCLGRGTHLFGEPGHDSNLVREILGAVPLGGFFCNGEIGPVNGTTYLHGYTSSFAFFCPR